MGILYFLVVFLCDSSFSDKLSSISFFDIFFGCCISFHRDTCGVSLPMLLKLAYVLDKNFDYFLLDTPYAKCESIINSEISNKLNQCSATTLITVSRILDALIEQQDMLLAEEQKD